MSTWKNVLSNPWADRSCGVPDDRTLLSGKIKTRTQYSFVPTSQGGATSLAHTGGFIVRPTLRDHIVRLDILSYPTMSVTDLNAAGTSITSSVIANGTASFYPTDGSANVRMVAAGVTVSYQGTELNRAGRYYAGLLPITQPAKANTAGVALSALSTIVKTTADCAVSTADLKSALSSVHTERVGDADLKLCWKPNGVPVYHRESDHDGLPYVAPAASGVVYESYLACNPGGTGAVYGDSCLVVLVENDNVAAVAATGNQYTVIVEAHWETIPSSQFDVIYPLSQSPFSPAALMATLNSIDRTSVLFAGSMQAKQPRVVRRRKGPTQPAKAAQKPLAAPTPSKTNKALAALLVGAIGAASGYAAPRLIQAATPARRRIEL